MRCSAEDLPYSDPLNCRLQSLYMPPFTRLLMISTRITFFPLHHGLRDPALPVAVDVLYDCRTQTAKFFRADSFGRHRRFRIAKTCGAASSKLSEAAAQENSDQNSYFTWRAV